MTLRLLQLASSMIVAYGLIRRVACPVLLRAALCIPLGLGVFSAEGCLVVSGMPASYTTFLAVIVSGLPYLSSKGSNEQAPSSRSAPRSVVTTLCLAIVVNVVVAVEHFRRFPDGGWDAWMIWTAHARRLWRATTFSEAFDPVLSQVHVGTHLDYPLGLPVMILQFYHLIGREHLLVTQLLSAMSGVFCAGILYASTVALAGPSAAAYAATILLSTPMFVLAMTSQCADLWVAVFALGGWSLLLLEGKQAQRNRMSRVTFLAGTFIGLTFFMKNEGIVFLAATFLFVAYDRGVASSKSFLAGAIPWVALVFLSKHQIGVTNDLLLDGLGASIARLASLSRWRQLLLAVARRVVYFQGWGVMAVGAAVIIGWMARRPQQGPARLLLPVIGMIFAIEITVLATTPYDVTQHVQVAVDRLVLQYWPAIVLAIVAEVGRWEVASPVNDSAVGRLGHP